MKITFNYWIQKWQHLGHSRMRFSSNFLHSILVKISQAPSQLLKLVKQIVRVQSEKFWTEDEKMCGLFVDFVSLISSACDCFVLTVSSLNYKTISTENSKVKQKHLCEESRCRTQCDSKAKVFFLLYHGFIQLKAAWIIDEIINRFSVVNACIEMRSLQFARGRSPKPIGLQLQAR